MFARMLILSVLLVSLSFSVHVISPVDREVENGDVIDLGTIGPGQTISILIDPIVTTGGVHGSGGTFDQAEASALPRDWISQPSELYDKPLQVTITANPDAPEGDYNFTVNVIDEYNGEELGNVKVTAKVHITWDVMDFDVSPAYMQVGPGQPARFEITIMNKGSTSDLFTVSATGAKRWEFVKPVFVPAQSSKTIHYEIVGAEEEAYKATIKVASHASPKIVDEKNVTLFVRSDLLGDYKATNHGTLVFQIFEAPVYAFAGLISNFFG